jgi:hypothetical protein
MTRLTLFQSLCLCVVLVSGCRTSGDAWPTGPSTISVDGTWIGTFHQSTNTSLTVTLSQSRRGMDPDQIRGAWALVASTTVLAGTVSGSSSGPSVSLTLELVPETCWLELLGDATRLRISTSLVRRGKCPSLGFETLGDQITLIKQ